MQPGVRTFLRLAAMVRSILDEPQVLLVVNLFDQVRRLHYGRTQANLISNIAVGSLGRISFAQTDGSKAQLLTKVNMFSDVYDKYVEFIDTAFVKIQHIVTALARHNRIVMPPHWNTPQVIMAMIQNVVENSMDRSSRRHYLSGIHGTNVGNGLPPSQEGTEEVIVENVQGDNESDTDSEEDFIETSDEEEETIEVPLAIPNDRESNFNNHHAEELHVPIGTATAFIKLLGNNTRGD